MTRIAYFRVSSETQSIASQRTALGGSFDKEFSDEGVSGTVLAAARPGFAKLLDYAREGDIIHVYAVDRLGRDALGVQSTVRKLLERGVSVDVKGLGLIGKGVGELILAVLAQVADMERQKIAERTAAGRVTAREHLARTGKTQHGKVSLGRPFKVDSKIVKAWRDEDKANRSIAATAAHFCISMSSVKRHCAA